MYKIIKITATSILLLLCFFSYAKSIAEQTLMKEELTKHQLQKHIEFLADDSLKGRKTGTPEYQIAANYVAEQFEQYGLTPIMANDSLFQSVPFIESTLDQSSAQLILHSDDKQIALNYQDDFFTFASAITQQDSVRAPLVFVGYGISSKELSHDDYQKIDVKGKIVIFIVGRPIAFPSEEGAHVSNIREKIKQAAIHGAVGVIVVDQSNNRTYETLRNIAAKPFLKWEMRDGTVFNEFPNLKSVSLVTSQAGEKIFSLANKSLTTIFNDIKKNQAPAGFILGTEATLNRKSSQKKIFSSNVVAMLEGSDPVLKNEYVVISAHLDHLGSEQDAKSSNKESDSKKKTDGISNGALDNASGIAVMLEVAKQIKEGHSTKRSIIFVAVTGEEQGLLGSNYFVHNPPVPLSSIVANINLDMVAMLYPFADVIAFGASHSSLNGNINEAALKNGISVSPDPMPEQAVFVRSDHYSFVKQGIPAIYLMVGLNSTDPTINASQKFMVFYGQHYHQPTDDISLAIDYQAGAVFTKISIDTVRSIADKKAAPTWNKDSYFGNIFAR